MGGISTLMFSPPSMASDSRHILPSSRAISSPLILQEDDTEAGSSESHQGGGSQDC